MDKEEDIEDVKVWDIDREKAYVSPKRISLVTEYILDHFDQKTYRKAFERTYSYNVLTNVSEVADVKKREQVQEIKQKQRVSGFNSIFAVSSVQAAKLYYEEFLKQMTAHPEKALKIAIIYSYGANKEIPTVFSMKKIPKIPLHSIPLQEISSKKLSATITSSSTRITIRQATSSRAITRTFRSV